MGVPPYGISPHHITQYQQLISNISIDIPNSSKNTLSTLSADYIGYFYYVFPLHLESFNRLFVDVINPKLLKLTKSVSEFICLEKDVTSFKVNLEGVFSYLDKFNSAEKLLELIRDFNGESYLNDVKSHIEALLDQLKNKMKYEEIISYLNSLAIPYNKSLEVEYERFKKKIEENRTSLEDNIKLYIKNINESLEKHCCCVQKLIDKICRDIESLETNKSKLGEFTYANKEQLMKISGSGNGSRTEISQEEMEKLKKIVETHKAYKQCLDGCSEITSKLNELEKKLRIIKNSFDNVSKLLKSYQSVIPATSTIEDNLIYFQYFKMKTLKNFDEYMDSVQKLQEIGGLITTMKNTLKDVENKVVEDAANYINQLKEITIKKEDVKNIKKIKGTNESVIAMLQIAKKAIEFYKSLKDEIGNLNGLTLNDYDFTQYLTVKLKVTSFETNIKSKLCNVNREINNIEKKIFEDYRIFIKIGFLPDESFYKKLTSPVETFIDNSLNVISVIKYLLPKLENNKNNSPKISEIKTKVNEITKLEGATSKLPDAVKALKKFLELQESTKSLIDTFKDHYKFSSLSGYSNPLEQIINDSKTLIAYINSSIDYLTTIRYVDYLTNCMKCYKSWLEKIILIIQNFNSYVKQIMGSLETINSYLCQLSCTLLKDFPGYFPQTTNGECISSANNIGNYILSKLKHYMNLVKVYVINIKTELTNLRVIMERMRKYIAYFNRYERVFDRLEKTVDEYIKWFERWTKLKFIVNYLKSIEDKINEILIIKNMIFNCLNITRIKNIESKLTCVESSVSELECAIEGVVRNFILCTLQSLRTNIQVAEINKINQVVNKYSLSNVMDYKVVVNRLVQCAKKIDQILQIVPWDQGCDCILRLELTNKRIAIDKKYVHKIIEKITSENNHNLKLDDIRNIHELGVGANHTCLCMVFKYILYPSIIKMSYGFFGMDLDTLSAISRKFHKYKNSRSVISNIVNVLPLVIDILEPIINLIRNNYPYAMIAHKDGVDIKCFCYYNQDKYYHLILNTLLVISSMIENIWSMDNHDISIAIECLSNFSYEFDVIREDNNIGWNKCKLFINQIVINKYCCSNSDPPCGPKCCCVTCILILMSVYMCIIVKINNKLFPSNCAEIIKNRLCCFIKLFCKYLGSQCCIKEILNKISTDLTNCNSISNNNSVCDQVISKCAEQCNGLTPCKPECICKQIKDCLTELCKALNGEVGKVLQCIENCCKTDGCKCANCKIVSYAIKVIRKNMDLIECNVKHDIKFNSLVFSPITWKGLYNNIRSLYLCRNELAIRLVKNNLLTHPNHDITVNALNTVKSRNWGYDTLYEHDITTYKSIISNDNYSNTLNNNENTLRKLHYFSSLLSSSVDRNFSLVISSFLEISS